MGWLDRFGRGSARTPDPGAPEEPAPTTVERASPGASALVAGLAEDGSHVVLDLGPAAPTHLRLFGRYARKIRFANLLPAPPRGTEWAAALRALPPHPERPYDIVLGWDLLDLLDDGERDLLVERLDALTAPGARLYLVVDDPGVSSRPRVRHTLVAPDRISQEVVGHTETVGSPLLPAQVERLLAPFEVVQAFTLRQRAREYVAVKGGEAAYSGRSPATPRPSRPGAVPTPLPAPRVDRPSP